VAKVGSVQAEQEASLLEIGKNLVANIQQVGIRALEKLGEVARQPLDTCDQQLRGALVLGVVYLELSSLGIELGGAVSPHVCLGEFIDVAVQA
jgi:hypothetical protein